MSYIPQICQRQIKFVQIRVIRGKKITGAFALMFPENIDFT